MTDEVRQTARVWEVDLSEPGRKLTTEELRTLEALHHCEMLGRLVVALENCELRLQALNGRFDRLERFLAALDPLRYPQTPQPVLPPPKAAR